MQHADFKDKVAEEFTANHSDTPKAHHLAVQCEIALKLLEAESQEVKTRIKKEAKADHQALLETHQSAVDGLPSVTEEERQVLNSGKPGGVLEVPSGWM
ncbi:hypothetical protein K438DRAFT_1965540 [Mycena galopus ATCC 62051]|nr:hypothetical protein K438DRAFT_1965540 [Mycena galopus ATCC 62051]